MQTNQLFMSMGAGGLALGLVLAATTPTRPHPVSGADWRSHVPYHPQPAALTTRDVAGEYVGFDYVNMGPDLTLNAQRQSDAIRAARLAAASYQPPRAEMPAMPQDDVMEIDAPAEHRASRLIESRRGDAPGDGGLVAVDGGDAGPADDAPQGEGPDDEQ